MNNAEAFVKLREQSQESIEERLKVCLAFMQESLAQEGTPDFKGFWQVRQFCFPLFKETFTGQARVQLWELYTELTREGRRLKGILDTESSFAAEQIGLALSDLEKQIEVVVGGSIEEIACAIAKWPQALKQRQAPYIDKQKVLSVLNVVATRIHELRKELVKTPMRMKQKNQLFGRLSALGDLVFPRRKELMGEVSGFFVADVEQFFRSHFAPEVFSADQVRRQVFFFRDEIKAFQSLAKSLTLETRTFMTTRVLLSQCWDQLKGMEKDLKKEFAEQKQQSAEHVEAFSQDIRCIEQRFAAGEVSVEEGLAQLSAMTQRMRQMALVKQDVMQLKELIAQISQPMHQQRQQAQQQARAQEAAIEQERKQKILDYRCSIESSFQGTGEINLPQLQERLIALRQQLGTINCQKGERQQLEMLLKQAKDWLLERQEMALLNLPDESRQVLDELRQMLEVRKEQRREIKGQLDEYRKVLAGSSLDIEKAMMTQERVAEEKEALEKCEASIVEIEKKIQDFKHRN